MEKGIRNKKIKKITGNKKIASSQKTNKIKKLRKDSQKIEEIKKHSKIRHENRNKK